MPKTPDVYELSRMANKARWANTTPEQRKAATAKACKARKKKAKERREAKEANRE